MEILTTKKTVNKKILERLKSLISKPTYFQIMSLACVDQFSRKIYQ